MAKLVLSRRIGESVMVGDLKLTVQEIMKDQVRISGSWLRVSQWIPIPGCDITLCAISGNQVKILFEADKSVKIVRTELLRRGVAHV